MSKKLSITNLNLNGKKVLMRVDFNVPQDKQGHIIDDTRIKAALPSIRYVLEHGGALILMSHLGRPKEGPSPRLSLASCAKRLSELLGQPVIMAPDCVGKDVEKLAKDLKPGQILMLENLRFHAGEEHPEKAPNFVRQLASLGDLYVNDAFGTAHRAHASTAEIAKYFPGNAAMGFLMEKEVKFLGNTLANPRKPFYALIGGAKISTKIGVLMALLEKADAILIGGGMAYTFFKAQGIPIGNSIHEDDLVDQAKDILKAARKSGVKLLLPQDNVIVEKLNNDAPARVVETKEGISNGWQGVDIGPKTIQQYVAQLQDGATVFWNGPMGVFELSHFAKGTNAIANAMASLKATTIIGGGESVAAVEAAGVADKMTHISTGGGAALEYIEFGKLPGIEALSNLQNEQAVSR
jgi:phosphoglycerate kinase